MNNTKQTKQQTSKIAAAFAKELESSNTICGCSPSALCRALGRQYWDNDRIAHVLAFIGGELRMSRKAIAGHARMGRTLDQSYGRIPSLDSADYATLDCIAQMAQ